MITKKLFLYFHQSETEKAIVYRLVKDYNLVVNIFRAKVTPDEFGYLVLDVTGEEKDIVAGIDYIKGFNVEVNEAEIGLRWDADRCAHCGNCVAHCPTSALSVADPKTRKIEFDRDACVECLSCIKNCPYAAITSIF